MPEGLEDADVAVETHSLLLSLAGLIDDELLGWCRELVAVGDSDYALELVAAAVQADRTRLPGPLHADLLAAAQRRRVLGRGDGFPSPDSAPRMPHRFAVDPTEHGFPARPEAHSPESALRAVPTRLLRDCQLWLTWRLTPAGGAPGPLPHPVVLIETADGLGAEVLAYQVAEVLGRTGVFASVEVFSSEQELGEYHRAALAQAHSMFGAESAAEPPAGRTTVSGTGPLEAVPTGPPPSPTPRARVEPPVNGNGGQPPRRAPENGTVRPGPDASRRPPMHPVDRVITARSSAPRRPRPDRQPGSLDDVASGLNFERGTGAFPAQPGTSEADQAPEDEQQRPPSADSPDRPQPDRPQPDRRGPERPRGDTPWNGSREPGKPPRDAAREDHPNPGPPPRSGPPPDRGQGVGPKRPGPRPSEGAESPADLSDIEQRLLRQLHEELAAREDGGTPMLPDSEPPSSRIFRGANGSRKRPPRAGPERP